MKRRDPPPDMRWVALMHVQVGRDAEAAALLEALPAVRASILADANFYSAPLREYADAEARVRNLCLVIDARIAAEAALAECLA